MKTLRASFPKRLRFAREMRELNQTELARKMNTAQSVIAHLESGDRLPSAENLACLCRALFVSADYLLGLSERVER